MTRKPRLGEKCAAQWNPASALRWSQLFLIFVGWKLSCFGAALIWIDRIPYPQIRIIRWLACDSKRGWSRKLVSNMYSGGESALAFSSYAVARVYGARGVAELGFPPSMTPNISFEVWLRWYQLIERSRLHNPQKSSATWPRWPWHSPGKLMARISSGKCKHFPRRDL